MTEQANGRQANDRMQMKNADASHAFVPMISKPWCLDLPHAQRRSFRIPAEEMEKRPDVRSRNKSGECCRPLLPIAGASLAPGLWAIRRERVPAAGLHRLDARTRRAKFPRRIRTRHASVKAVGRQLLARQQWNGIWICVIKSQSPQALHHAGLHLPSHPLCS